MLNGFCHVWLSNWHGTSAVSQTRVHIPINCSERMHFKLARAADLIAPFLYKLIRLSGGASKSIIACLIGLFRKPVMIVCVSGSYIEVVCLKKTEVCCYENISNFRGTLNRFHSGLHQHTQKRSWNWWELNNRIPLIPIGAWRTTIRILVLFKFAWYSDRESLIVAVNNQIITKYTQSTSWDTRTTSDSLVFKSLYFQFSWYRKINGRHWSNFSSRSARTAKIVLKSQWPVIMVQ